jgi:hypothetical protein
MMDRELEKAQAKNGKRIRSAPDDPLSALAKGPLYWFRDWPNQAVPKFCAGVYTIWHDDGQFMYVGMSGRSITAESAPAASPSGLRTRLCSHFRGGRSGDQFCVYVADRLILPTLTPTSIEDITAGRHSMDAHIRTYIHANLGYRFLTLPSGKAALEIERRIKNGAWPHGKPFLSLIARSTRILFGRLPSQSRAIILSRAIIRV